MKAIITGVEQYGDKVKVYWKTDEYGEVARELPFSVTKEDVILDVQVYLKSMQSTLDNVNRLQELIGMEI